MEKSESTVVTFGFRNLTMAIRFQDRQLKKFRERYPNTTTSLGIVHRNQFTVNYTLKS